MSHNKNTNITTRIIGIDFKKKDNRSLGSNKTTSLDNLINNTNNIGQLTTNGALPFYVVENKSVYNPKQVNQLSNKDATC
jgi:hypothetical protein